jgi:hypothetical protein
MCGLTVVCLVSCSSPGIPQVLKLVAASCLKQSNVKDKNAAAFAAVSEIGI